MYPVSTSAAQALDRRWGSTINTYKGAAPRGLALAHMAAESDGDPDKVGTGPHQRMGLMQVSRAQGKLLGLTQENLLDPRVNIYAWGVWTNRNSAKLKELYPSYWSTGNVDFWLSVRAYWVLGRRGFESLLQKVTSTPVTDAVASAVIAWIKVLMPSSTKIGKHRAPALRILANELLVTNAVIGHVDGNVLSTPFTQAPPSTPGGLDAGLAGQARIQ